MFSSRTKWIDDKRITVSQRSKEDAHDYRYFPDPDLPPVLLSEEYIKEVKSQMAKMPGEWRKILEEVGINKRDIETLLEAEVEFDNDFLTMLDESEEEAKTFAKWLINIEIPMHREYREKSKSLSVDNEKRKRIYNSVLELVEQGKLSSNNAKVLLIKSLEDNNCPDSIEEYANELNLIQVSDDGELKEVVKKVIEQNPGPVQEIKEGKDKVIGFLVGQVMKETKGQANPSAVQKIIRSTLEI